MARTTVDIDGPVLQELKRLQKREGKTLGRLISDLLARALIAEKRTAPKTPPFKWLSKNMGVPRVDLDDKDAVQTLLDQDLQTRW